MLFVKLKIQKEYYTSTNRVNHLYRLYSLCINTIFTEVNFVIQYSFKHFQKAQCDNTSFYTLPTLPMLGYAVHIFKFISIQATKYQRNVLFAKYVQNVDTFYNL